MSNHGEKQPNSWRKFLRLPVFLIANLALFLLIGISTIRETYRGWTVDKEISALQSQAESLEGKKNKLAELTQTLSSPERVELDARSRLGWKKDGERVYVLAGYQAKSGTTDTEDSLILPQLEHKSNPRLWLEYFFQP